MAEKKSHKLIYVSLFIITLIISILIGYFLPHANPSVQNNKISTKSSNHTFITPSPYGKIITTETVGVQNGIHYQIIQSQTVNDTSMPVEDQLTPKQAAALQEYMNQQTKMMYNTQNNLQQLINNMPNLEILLSPDQE